MIIARLTGGLGNQLFQYAHGRARALACGEELALDISGYADQTNVTPRAYKLDTYPICARLATADEIRPFWPAKTGVRLLDRALTRLWPHLPKRATTTYLQGYWQDEKYFHDVTETIRAELTLPATALSVRARELAKEIQNVQAVSLHVRRTDYLQPNSARYLPLCTESYYTRALAHVRQQTSIEHVYVFSDDPEWAHRLLPADLPSTVVSDTTIGLADVEELFLMSQCKHHIIANSTFSWWGAWLNPSTTKIVVTPTPWFVHPRLKNQSPALADWVQLPL